MGTKSEGSASRRSGHALSTAVDAEQARLLKILARRAGEPVTYDELRDAGVEYPASLVSEMELAGIEVERCQAAGPAGRPARAVRLPAAAEKPGPPPSGMLQLAPVSQQAQRRAAAVGSSPRSAAAAKPLPRPTSAPQSPRASAPAWGAVRVYRNSLARSFGTAWTRAFGRGDEARFAAEAPTSASRSRPSLRLLAPIALVIASAVIVAVVLTATADQNGHPKLAVHHNRPAATPAHAAGTQPQARAKQARVKTPAPARSASSSSQSASTAPAAPGSPSTTSSTQQSGEAPSVAAATPAASTKPAATETESPVNSSAANNLPGAAVKAFYEAAAHHRYADAWALADSNMRNEVDGYAAFEEQMSTVRAITFHEIATMRQAPDSALVAVRTTSEQTNRTQQCSGTVRTVYPAGVWLLDGISIHCT
jgi:hypothetical protein